VIGIESAGQGEDRLRTRWVAAIPILAFCLVVLLALLLYARDSWQLRQVVRERQEANLALGLPRDYPSDLVPLYPGFELLEATRGGAASTEGEPMDMWVVKGQLQEEDRQHIYDFYNQHLRSAGLRQTMYITIPSGGGAGLDYGVYYSDENHAISFVIERKSGDEMTRLEVTIHRLRD
jgi:hypothetical protein